MNEYFYYVTCIQKCLPFRAYESNVQNADPVLGIVELIIIGGQMSRIFKAANLGPCIFPPFECSSKSKTNSEKRKSKFRYSFWKLTPKRKAEVRFPLFVLVLPLQNKKWKRFSFWYFQLQNEKRKYFCYSFWFKNE